MINLLKASSVVVLILSASVSVAAEVVGDVKLCRADNRSDPSVPSLTTSGMELTGDGASISIPAKSVFSPAGGSCVITKALAQGDDAPHRGARWTKDVAYPSQIIHMSGGQMASEETTVNITITAEAVEDFAPIKKGKIKVCRYPGITGLMDGKPVPIPAGNYSGACDKNGENCRNITVSATTGTLGANKHACITLNALLTQGDGKPLKVGSKLDAEWSIAGFEPLTKVAKAFK